MRKIVFPILLGVIGCAILLGLGNWQLQRLAWKTEILTAIDARITAKPTAVPLTSDPDADQYLPVELTGTLTGAPIFILVTPKGLGPGYRYIQAFETEAGRRVMLDLGWVSLDWPAKPEQAQDHLNIIGNLHWPDEKDSWTPEPDPKGIWFARHVPDMAAHLRTEPILVVARDYTHMNADNRPQTPLFQPLPLDSRAIKNDHLNYAITWFSLAFVWLVMTAYWIVRIRQRDR